MSEEYYNEALERFRDVMSRAEGTGFYEPAAMTLATVGADGRVSARVVLLRGWDPRGFVFYTNLESDKGKQLDENPRAALCFHWDPLKEQVRIEGSAEHVSDAEADEYWHSRPRESQIGAWASEQSRTLKSLSALEQRVEEIAKRYEGMPVPRPDFWSGFRIVPNRIEFWAARPARLHWRFVYELTDSGWTRRMLYP